jgi:hypothetical protein
MLLVQLEVIRPEYLNIHATNGMAQVPEDARET